MTEETSSWAVSILSWLVFPLFDLDDHAFNFQITSTKTSFVKCSMSILGTALATLWDEIDIRTNTEQASAASLLNGDSNQSRLFLSTRCFVEYVASTAEDCSQKSLEFSRFSSPHKARSHFTSGWIWVQIQTLPFLKKEIYKSNRII